MSEPTDIAHLYLTDLSPGDKPWETHRAESDVVQSLYQGSEFHRYAERMQECSQRLIFAMAAETEEEFRLRLRAAHFCRVRHCPICQWRRSMRWKARFLTALPDLISDYPKARYIFLTLTVRNCDLTELRANLSWMNKSWERLSKRKEFPAIGWVKSVEVTRNPRDLTAHPHFHVLMMVNPSYFKGTSYIRQDRWRELWQQSLRVDYLPVVHVKTVRSRFSESLADPETSTIDVTDALVAGLLETLKYGVKVADLVADPVWLHELTRQLHKTRAVAVGGVLREYIQEAEPEDLITEDESLDPVGDDALLIYFDWMSQVRRYAKVDPETTPKPRKRGHKNESLGRD